MSWQSQLINVYLNICEFWDQGVCNVTQRYSNNNTYSLSDQEVATIYIYGVISGRSSIKQIYNFIENHLRDWFPCLGKYAAYCHRLNQISDAFIPIVELLVEQLSNILPSHKHRKLVDSMPIIMANNKRSSQAKVAPELADKGYCESKKMYYYGVKLHVVGFDRDETFPRPDQIGLSQASFHDLPVFSQISTEIVDRDVIGDKAYGKKEFQYELKNKQNVALTTPIKLKKGQTFLDSADKLYSTAVSKIRQPIESFFNWLNEKTTIQSASKVRSSKGLLVHVFGKLAAGLMMLKF